MRRTGIRLAFLAVLLATTVAGIGSNPASAADDTDGVISPAWTIVDSGGNWGDYFYEDTYAYPGVECWNHGTAVDVTLTAPWPYANSDYYYQPVSLYWDIYRVNSNSTVTRIKTSPKFVLTAYYNSPAYFSDYTFYNLPLGPTYVGVARITWHNGSGGVVGFHDARYDYYLNYTNGSYNGVKNACYSPYHPTASLSPNSGTVNSNASFSISSYPPSTTIGVRWDGTLLGTIGTNSSGKAAGSFKIPAAPMGTHKVRFSVGSIAAERTFTVIPRIKVIPGTVSRGQTVNISLRGFAKKETVRIRWKKGSTWVQLATVVTSNTGSANIDVKVPSWVPDGPTSVRGDGTYGRAQTNAVTVSGGTYHASEATKTPTPSPTSTTTATPTVTASPSATVAPTQTPEATATIDPTTPEGTPEPTITETPSPVTETATPEPTPETTTEAAPSEATPGDSSG